MYLRKPSKIANSNFQAISKINKICLKMRATFIIKHILITVKLPWLVAHLRLLVAPQNGQIMNSRPHRYASCQFPFRWIYYCHSSKSTGKETNKTHFCGPVYCLQLCGTLVFEARIFLKLCPIYVGPVMILVRDMKTSSSPFCDQCPKNNKNSIECPT